MTAHVSTEIVDDHDHGTSSLSSVANPRRVRWTSLQHSSAQDG